MNTQSSSGHNLESRLREHYAAKVNGLRLSDIAPDDLLAKADVRLASTAASTAAGGRRTSLLVAAALVGGAVLGASAIMLGRDEPSTGDRPVEVPQQGPVVGSSPSGGRLFGGCEEIPDIEPRSELYNDIRLASVLLPVIPDDWCVIDHTVSAYFGAGLGSFEAYSACTGCDAPTASVAIVDAGQDLEYVYESDDVEPTELDVAGHRARYYEPSGDNPVARLYVDVGADAPFTMIGWGLDADQMASAAAAALSDERLPAERELPSLEYAGGGLLNQFWPGDLPFASQTLNVAFWVDGGDVSHVYSVLQFPDQPPLDAYAWARPGATFATEDGHRTLTFPPSASFGASERTTVIREIDELTTVVWTSNGAPPVAAEELAAIELTPAAPDDPRWDEIAFESGMYDARG